MIDIDRELNYKFLRMPADKRLELAINWGLFNLELAEKIDVEVYQGFLKLAKEFNLSDSLLEYILDNGY